MSNSIAKTLLSYRNALSLNDYKFTNIRVMSNDLALALVTEMAHLGYTLSRELLQKVGFLSKSDLKKFHESTIKLLREVSGADVKYAPLFREFPDHIPNRDVIGLAHIQEYNNYFYALYFKFYGVWSSKEYNGTWWGRQFPGVTVEESIERPELVCSKPLKVLQLASTTDVINIFKNLVGAKGSISNDDKVFVQEVINSGLDIIKHFPEEIPNKENLAYVISCIYDNYGFSSEIINMVTPYVKTATDVLRLAAGFSGGDVSLAEHKKFKLSNSQRKFILTALDAINYNNATEDMLRFHSLWLILLKYLHVGAYSDTYSNVAKMANAIRNHPKDIETFNRNIEKLLPYQKSNKKWSKEFLQLLSSRPGDFARRLDNVLRNSPIADEVVKQFLAVADKVASPLLLNLATHFYHRTSKANVRVYCPKGSTTHATVVRGDDRVLFNEDIIQTLVSGINAILVKRYATKGTLGKVYIDSNLEDILIPTSMRDSSSALKVAARGSKFKIDDNAKIVRLFLYWEDQKTEDHYDDRVDIDLSAMTLDENFQNTGVVSYYNLRSGRGDDCAVVHSGDFTSAPNGAAEFIDVDIDRLLKENPDARYIAVTINSYTGQAFNTIVAKGGYMVRDGISGKTFEAAAVEHKYDITAGTKYAVPMILDLKERKVIWMDLGLVDTNARYTNIETKGADLATLAQYAVEMYREKANLLNLLMLHTEGRADSISFVFDKNEKYDHVFDMSWASKIDEIMASFI